MDKEYTSEQILEGIKQHDMYILNFLYKEYYGDIQRLIYRNHGKKEDAKDVFQESIIVIFRQIEQKDLTLSCSFKTYLYSVCRNIWLKQLERKNLAYNYKQEKLEHSVEWDEEMETLADQNEKYALFQKHFQRLTENCKKILKHSLEGLSVKKIAELMGYTSENYTKKRKFQCKENLISRIQNDPCYEELV